MRFFNTAGPVDCERHYCLPPLERLNLKQVLALIEQQKYFILHAPRQTGKTSSLLALMKYLNAQGNYRCLYINVEAGQAAREDVAAAMRSILNQLASRARITLNDHFLDAIWVDALLKSGPHSALDEVLTQWSVQDIKPVVLFIDEIDSLIGDTLISVLRQLRAGYDKRPRHFPQSVILCGVRDVRDYRIHSASEKTIITGGSAFNIKAASLRLGDFSRPEVERLYAQHTTETGQIINSDALERIWDLTQGQPWLVNALGYETCFEMEEGQDRSQPITMEMVDDAKENLILRRETHLDQLADKLQEERVRRVIEPLLAGQGELERVPMDDIDYVRDLGLIRVDREIRIANPIYREIIPRQLTYSTEVMTHQQAAWYVDPDGRLNMIKLLIAFQEFFREHSEHWVERFQYKKAGPQLLLQAFLQRIVNGGGRIEREYGLGRMRTDLLVIWPYPGGVQKVVIELKVLHKTLEQTIATGLEQTWSYLDRCGAEAGHLVIFDRTPGKPWEEKLFQREALIHDRTIQVWGM
ncbi:MAG: AAA-like domain-containing protein [Candidatus Competibacteraceae bacterium]